MIGKAILKTMSGGKPKNVFQIHRSAAERYDIITGLRQNVSRETITVRDGAVKHIGLTEIQTTTGKRSVETISVRWGCALYGAVEQDNTGEDIIIWNGARWRVISVKILRSTWRATAIRTNNKEDICDDPDASSTKSDVHFVGVGRK